MISVKDSIYLMEDALMAQPSVHRQVSIPDSWRLCRQFFPPLRSQISLELDLPIREELHSAQRPRPT